MIMVNVNDFKKEMQTLTVSNSYTLQEASKIMWQEQSLPYDERSQWRFKQTGARVYFTGYKKK